MRKYQIVLLIAWAPLTMLGVHPPLWAGAALDVLGTFSLKIGESDLVDGPGSPLRSEYATDPGQLILDISGNPNPWRIDVRQIGINWNPALTLFVRRTTAGTGSGTLSGGMAYQLLTNQNRSLFAGTQNRSDVRIQLKLAGVSLRVPQRIYRARVSFTVVEL